MQRSFYDPYGSQQAQQGMISSAIGGVGSFAAMGSAMSLTAGAVMGSLGIAGAATVAGLAVPLGVAAIGAGVLLAPAIAGEFIGKAVSDVARIGRMARRTEFATQYVDTRAAYTMRQQAMRFMHDSAYSLRATLGSEAQLFHS